MVSLGATVVCAPFLASHVPASAARRTCAAAGRIRLVPGRASAVGARAGGPVAVVPPVMGTPLMPPSPPMAVLVASAGGDRVCVRGVAADMFG